MPPLGWGRFGVSFNYLLARTIREEDEFTRQIRNNHLIANKGGVVAVVDE